MKTTNALPHHQHAGAFLIEVVIEFVTARCLRLDLHDTLAVSANHLLDVQAVALEFHAP